MQRGIAMRILSIGTDLDDLEGVIALFAFFTEFDCFAGQTRQSG